jgi:diguanylate cyclase (GGDEF)-like protein
MYYEGFMDTHHIQLAPLERTIIMLVHRIGAGYVTALITIVSITLSVLATLAFVIPQFSLEYSNDLILAVSLIIAMAIPLLVAPITVGLCISLLIRLDNAYVNLLKLSTTDSLTGATNRRGFFAEATARVQGLSYNDSAFVGMVDLDSFKVLNDNFGHQVGDKALCAVVQRLQLVLGYDHIVGRLGGDEFAFLITGSLSRNKQVMQEIHAQCRTFSIDIEGSNEPIVVSSSIGIAQWDRQESLDQALARADNALYAEKDFGRASDGLTSRQLRNRDR